MISSVFPENGILYASVFMLIDQFMLWTLGVKLTSPTGEGGFKLKKMINPATVAIVLAIVLKFTGIRIPILLDTDLFKNRIYRISTCNDYVGGIFAGISLKKISQGNFSVWNCIA